MGISAYHIGKDVGIGGVRFSTDTAYRSQYRDACSGLIPNTAYPAAISASTHRPRSVSIPTST
jgi:hypothetical protein